MEIVVRMILLFIFIQFLVVVTIMSVAILLARPEYPMFGDMGHEALGRTLGFVIHAPVGTFRSSLRLVHQLRIRGRH